MKRKLLFVAGFFILSGMTFAQQNQWSRTSPKKADVVREKPVRISQYELFNLNMDGLRQQLSLAPERNKQNSVKGTLIRIPNDKEGYDTFEVFEASTMHPDLQARYSDIRSYAGQKTGDPTTKIRFSVDPYFGFNAMVKNADHTYYIDSYSQDQKTYMLYDRKNAISPNGFECLFKGEDANGLTGLEGKTVVDGLLRKYRLAITTTTEYTDYTAQQAGVATGTVAQKKAAVLAAVNLAIARINQVYEKEISVSFQLVANTDQLFFVGTDTFDASDDYQMIDENVVVTNNVIGLANYDIGHLFSRGGNSGLAGTPSACTGDKAAGITGSANPVGDPFVIDFVAHEMGHQFGANHTQNNSCNRNTPTSVEPGSGSSIMGYAGICSPNVQGNSDAYFHAVSIAEMYTWITTGGNCGVNTATGNHAPTANAGPDKTIPMGTPFALTGVGNDPDNDSVTYNWEQIDTGAAQMPPRPTNTVGPMFRTLWETVSPTRYFPRLSTIVEGYDPTIVTASNYRAWEKLSSVARPLKFSLLVRDNNPVGGQSGRDDIQLTVSAAAGPFVVTSQNTAGIVWNVGQSQTITWDVANTNVAPVNTTNVSILLSTDGGLTFPQVLVASTPNNGSYTFNVPEGLGTSSKVRIMIKAVDNVFLNVNKTNFSINSTLGTKEIEKAEEGIKIYPNPSKGVFTIEAESKNGLSYSVFAMDGKLVNAKKEVKNGKVREEVNLSHLPIGTYIIQLDKEGQKVSKKLIIEK
ncbi:T9SS C-terminal target domain-containing protein [Chryseobacterium sp. G0186]|uniref:reprolysin-like metallopeptidase n=1 Tax=Chryseobacterium sp. G0186 TaxID=2487064 RepID=UPI000F4D6B54|nr:zinc-dependent metalloprotease family protein [Chryseobacterium sp. G0186]AZA79953.1 T9SS C-terminal target domain-containing protein [Chryseobacterium sp. G0186]